MLETRGGDDGLGWRTKLNKNEPWQLDDSSFKSLEGCRRCDSSNWAEGALVGQERWIQHPPSA